MRFEVGKFYKCRSGEKVQIIWDKFKHPDIAFLAVCEDGEPLLRYFKLDGSSTHPVSPLGPLFDIECEWEEPKPKRVACGHPQSTGKN